MSKGGMRGVKKGSIFQSHFLNTLIKEQSVCGFYKIGVKLRETWTRLDSRREDELMMMMMSRMCGNIIMW